MNLIKKIMIFRDEKQENRKQALESKPPVYDHVNLTNGKTMVQARKHRVAYYLEQGFRRP